MRILIADDEETITIPLQDDLEEAGHRVRVVHDGDRALAVLQQEPFDCLITDLNMPGMRGEKLLTQAAAVDPAMAVLVVTGYGTIESAVEAMKAGATDYILKPFRNDQIIRLLETLDQLKNLEDENRNLREQIEDLSPFEGIVGSSEAMQKVFATVRTVSMTDANVLVIGATGTGKELISRAIHHRSGRRKGPFVAISCAAIPSALLEDELFGHEPGAFTDARDRKVGRLERAQKGTFFLDDIDDMPRDTQVKLLRVLQERELERLGGSKAIKLDIRVIAASKLDLKQMVSAGKFREDLFYRINVVPLKLPSLMERAGDIPLLVQHFLNRFSPDREFQIRPEDMEAMEVYSWPGNVRELQHAVERAVALAGRSCYLKREHLVERNPVHRMAPNVPQPVLSLREVVEQAERQQIEKVLKLTGYHRAETARQLGISRKNLWEKMKLYGIGDPER